MTVDELFDKFTVYFDKIVYFDEANNIEDTIDLKNGDDFLIMKYDDFLEEYGDCEITDWNFDNSNNTIEISFKR